MGIPCVCVCGWLCMRRKSETPTGLEKDCLGQMFEESGVRVCLF